MPPLTFHFSPSDNHGALVSANQPELRYAGEPVAAWQERVRPRLEEVFFGSMRGMPRAPLNVRSLWRREHPLGTIEKIVFTTEEGSDAPAYVCVPKVWRTPRTWVICLQGHSSGMHNAISVDAEDDSRPIPVVRDRDTAIALMQHGIAALCVEQRAFGMRREASAPPEQVTTCRDAMLHGLMLGRTLQGERVYDVDRAIDYLLTREDVDPERIGVMGASGGGTISLVAAALLPRIAFAVPVVSFSTFADSIMAMHHCECNYVPGLLRLVEAGDIAGLVAPRPLLIVNGDEDPIFPLEGARREFAHVQEIYRAAGAADNCRHVIGRGGHRLFADATWPVLLELLERVC